MDNQINGLKVSDLKNIDEVIKKADVLIEALPYIRKYRGKFFVIKYGGSTMAELQMREHILKDLIFLKSFGIHPILVHGGGKKISQFMQKVGKSPDFVDGLRITDQETMELTEMALSQVNSEIVGFINKLGQKAIGLSGKDGNLIEGQKKPPVQPTNGNSNKKAVDLGQVGEVGKINPDLLIEISNQEFIPVISPFAADEKGTSLNINADHVAGELASAIGAEKLVLLTNVPGIMEKPEESDTFYPTLTVQQTEAMINQGKIHKGMIPKVTACVKANKSGVRRTHIIDGGTKHALLLEIFTNECLGTMVIHSNDKEVPV